MEQKSCVNCVFCRFAGFDTTDMDDIELYKCTNKESKCFKEIFDRFTVDLHKCREHKFDPELT